MNHHDGSLTVGQLTSAHIGQWVEIESAGEIWPGWLRFISHQTQEEGTVYISKLFLDGPGRKGAPSNWPGLTRWPSDTHCRVSDAPEGEAS